MSGNLINQPELYESSDIPEIEKERLRVAAKLDPAGLGTLFATTPKLSLVNVALKDTKVSFILEDGLRKLVVRTQSKISKIKYNYNEIDFDLGVYHTIEEGQPLVIDGLKADGLTFYFSTSDDNRIIEIQQWT